MNSNSMVIFFSFYFTKTKPSEIEVLFHDRLLDMTLLGGWKAGVALG